ncbi:MAG: IS4 family transposase, partial [Microcystis sp. M39BS1]|nr:IS4 family transposase [Microcystis sp. M39BS1]
PLFIKRVRHLKSRPPWPEAVRMIASLGGFLGRKGDGEPGVKTIWLGLGR